MSKLAKSLTIFSWEDDSERYIVGGERATECVNVFSVSTCVERNDVVRRWRLQEHTGPGESRGHLVRAA